MINSDFVGKSVWRVVDSHWTCIDSTSKCVLYKSSLCDFLSDLGISLPDYLTYGLFETSEFTVKFRHFGGTITIYVNLKSYVKNISSN